MFFLLFDNSEQEYMLNSLNGAVLSTNYVYAMNIIMKTTKVNQSFVRASFQKQDSYCLGIRQHHVTKSLKNDKEWN